MKNRILWISVLILSFVCIGEGFYIYRLKNSQKTENNSSRAIPPKTFDDLFDDEFFSRRHDPFTEIEEFHKKFRSLLEERQNSLWGQSWNDWFDSRMNLAGIQQEIKTTEKEVIVSFKIPGLQDESFSLDINRDRIRIKYDVKTDQNDAHSRMQTVQHIEKVMPIPQGANPDKNRVEREGNEVKIIFERLAPREDGIKF